MDSASTPNSKKTVAAVATLYLICGKIAAGKSTFARQQSEQAQTVLISEDFWLANLYPGQIESLEDYARSCSVRSPSNGYTYCRFARQAYR